MDSCPYGSYSNSLSFLLTAQLAHDRGAVERREQQRARRRHLSVAPRLRLERSV